MTRDDALHRLRSHEAELRAAGLAALYLFGSTARDEARDDSDVDLLADLKSEGRYSLLDHFRLEDELAALLGTKVDLVVREGLRPRIRRHAEEDSVRIF